jgi:hypothetical protein
MGGLIARRQMRASPTPPPVGPRPALPDQDGTNQNDEQRDQSSQDHDQHEGHATGVTNRIEPAQA